MDKKKDFGEDCALCDDLFCRLCDLRGDPCDFSKLCKSERVVVAVWHSNGIIGNGGFEYLFEHDFVGDPGFIYTAAAYSAIGCTVAANAFKKALSIFKGNCPPDDMEERKRVLYLVPKDVRDQINIEFWHDKSIEPNLADYIRLHRSEFNGLIE